MVLALEVVLETIPDRELLLELAIVVGNTAISVSGVGARADSNLEADVRAGAEIGPSSVAGVRLSCGNGGEAGCSSKDDARAASNMALELVLELTLALFLDLGMELASALNLMLKLVLVLEFKCAEMGAD